jgi:hypothetical protein
MNNKDKKTELMSLAVAEERIRAIEKRVAAIKTERTALNRQKHLLAKWADLLREPIPLGELD